MEICPRITLEIDAQPAVPLIDMREALLAYAMANDTPVVIIVISSPPYVL
jgi:hypothetical protein